MVTGTPPAEEPSTELADPGSLLAGYLDYYRQVVARKVDGLSEAELHTRRLPSGWVPLGMIKHLTFAERHWIHHVYGGEPLPLRRFPDGRRDTGWEVLATDNLAAVLGEYEAVCQRSRELVNNADLTERAKNGPHSRPAKRPTLAWILFHLLQEYARHAGHLDIATELLTAPS